MYLVLTLVMYLLMATSQRMIEPDSHNWQDNAMRQCDTCVLVTLKKVCKGLGMLGMLVPIVYHAGRCHLAPNILMHLLMNIVLTL